MMVTFKHVNLARTLLIGALAALAYPATAAGPNLNPEYGDAVYREFSVFSPDAATPADYKPDVVLVFHGFASAVPNGTFKRVRKKLLSTHTALGINYNPLDVAGTQAFLRRVHTEHLQGKRVTVLGTSLGGFWARYFGHIIKAHKVVMLNPMIRPEQQLARYTGTTRVNERRHVVYNITALALAPYAGIDASNMSGPKSLLIVTRDDDRQPPEIALQALQGTPELTVRMYETGGHTINLKKHEALGLIADFVSGN
ncbi:MAG: putative esterase YcpF (UPF0227 family) [Gammaproteobacteria bacterium]|jgi:predicted esterase YcpF (UPF0227 family)